MIYIPCLTQIMSKTTSLTKPEGVLWFAIHSNSNIKVSTCANKACKSSTEVLKKQCELVITRGQTLGKLSC
jgi:hypothetical protein